MNNYGKRIIILAELMVLLCAGQVMAQTKVLGFQLGKSTYHEVKVQLPEGIQIEKDDGVPTKHSGGPVIRTDGTGYGINGLLGVVFWFDQKQILTEVGMGLEDRRFNDVKEILSSKYQLMREYPGVRLLFKSNRDYVYLYFPRDAAKDMPDTYSFGVQYITDAVYQKEQLRGRQTEVRKKAFERENKKAHEREAAEKAAKF